MEFDRNPTLDALCARKSVRVFTEEPVPQAVKNALFQAAMQAPTAGNQMLYTILDITDAALKARLARPVRPPALHRGRTRGAGVCGGLPALVRRLCRGGLRTPSAAGGRPAAGRGRTRPSPHKTRWWPPESFGLGSCYIGDILENCEDVRSALALPPYAVPAAMLVLGRPTQQQRERRKPPASTRGISYGKTVTAA